VYTVYTNIVPYFISAVTLALMILSLLNPETNCRQM